jgi:hypothetical protein
MQKHSATGPIIVGCAIIILIIGAVMASLLGKQGALTQTPSLNTEDTPTASTTQTIPEVPQSNTTAYTNTTLGYSLEYPKGFTLEENKDYNPAPDVKLKVTEFIFPTSLFEGSTVRDADIKIARTNMACSIWINGESKLPVTATKNINDYSFELRKDIGAAAGNIYTTYEYSTVKDTKCYRALLSIHNTQPGAEFDDEATIQAKTELNKKIEQDLVKIFEAMMATFEFAST